MRTAAQGIEVVAHRGASAYAPEHTFAAYDLALSLGADALELDLRTTADGELVVLHDQTLARTAGDPRTIAELDRAGLAALDPAVRPLPLDAVLERYGDATRYLLEMKDPHPLMERRLVDALVRHRLRERVEVMSFKRAGLRRLGRLDPSIALSPLYFAPLATVLLPQIGRAARYATAIGVHRHAADPALVAAAHARGLRIRAYTVNDAGELARLAALGFDGLITDAPDRARAAAAAA
ncbi:MAG TPA: glycerophosphodiester phosphodiesterase family protein, partial [Solirubrobacteraceae bacterium]